MYTFCSLSPKSTPICPRKPTQRHHPPLPRPAASPPGVQRPPPPRSLSRRVASPPPRPQSQRAAGQPRAQRSASRLCAPAASQPRVQRPPPPRPASNPYPRPAACQPPGSRANLAPCSFQLLGGNPSECEKQFQHAKIVSPRNQLVIQ